MSDNELVVIPQEKVFEVFTSENGLAPFIEKIRQHALTVVPDMTTKKGRDQIRSLAANVARSKTYIDDVGKALTAEYKEVPKRIDAARKAAREALDELRDEVRKPLTEYEAKEKQGQELIEWLLTASDVIGQGIEGIQARIEQVQSADLSPADFIGRTEDAKTIQQNALAALGESLAAAEKAEADRLELERLRQAEAERQQREREEQIRQEAAQKAAEQAKRDAELADQRRIEAEQRAAEQEAARIEAEKNAQEQAKQAAERERQRIENEQAAEQQRIEAAQKAREQDQAHRKAINTAALNAFVDGGLDPETAKIVITMIARKQIPAIAITY